MKLMVVCAALALSAVVGAQELARRSTLRVLYVGEADRTDRTTAFESFLRERFADVRTVTHAELTHEAAGQADVVLLDWHQGGQFPPARSPLGSREEWSRPTVLLGSAGLLTACAWEVFGGSG